MSAAEARADWVDGLRGVAVVWMVAYHFCFDLNLLGFARFAMLSDPWWTTQRTAIVSLFMLSAGLSQVLAWRAGQTRRMFWRRWTEIAGCAGLVSVATWWMFGAAWIYFGVLHAMAVMWLLTRGGLVWLASRPGFSWRVLLFVAALVGSSAWWVPALLHAMGATDGQALLNTRAFSALGWVSHKPVTEDYVPLAPWMGVLWLGVAWGLWRWPSQVGQAQQPMVETAAAWAWSPRWLRFLGRHSLVVYMVHQPVLLGALHGIKALQG
jgi:uncharacterized membrane protein